MNQRNGMELDLLTERLTLRPLRQEDIDLGIELLTDPEVTRYTWGDPLPVAKIESEMQNSVKRCGGGCIGVWCVGERSTSEKLGTGALLPMPIDKDDTDWGLVDGPHIPGGPIEVGYILKRSAWGKGYATEICRRLLKFAFEETELAEVMACTDVRNENSKSVLAKCDFEDLGLQLAYGEKVPCFRITQERWAESARPGAERTA